MRYRPPTTTPGRNRPSSTLLVELSDAPITAVSADVESSGLEQCGQYRLPSGHECAQAGHAGMEHHHTVARAFSLPCLDSSRHSSRHAACDSSMDAPTNRGMAG